jgi:large subunit ribosomal protein L25
MKFTAFERTQQGTGASRRLRNAGKVPGIVYGAGQPANIELDHNALYFALKKEAFHSSILEMELGSSVHKVLLRDFQMHPWKQQVLHVDFQRVDEATRLRKKVPLHFSGEENSPAVKTDKCLVNHVATELEIECLASQLPEFVTIDLSFQGCIWKSRSSTLCTDEPSSISRIEEWKASFFSAKYRALWSSSMLAGWPAP